MPCMKTLALLLLLTPALFAQLPDRGTISDLAGKTKVYVVADTEHLKLIKKGLAKSLTLVNSPTDAEFFLEYTVSRHVHLTSLEIPSETGQLDAYLMRGSTKVVAWSDNKTDGGFGGPAAEVLAKRFVKALNKPEHPPH